MICTVGNLKKALCGFLLLSKSLWALKGLHFISPPVSATVRLKQKLGKEADIKTQICDVDKHMLLPTIYCCAWILTSDLDIELQQGLHYTVQPYWT